ncbi:glycosyltransferase family 87 protein [Pedobacter mucosus]|uniref:glycosyltransferase family 87 protein n=1 Tax=Pedobacter mucosus TaxID=2895286 RepID=UPI001EE4981B|nr:glycosyltransferase family 87 protein [Pedobacter mucosus]UKT65706.1 DUF2029 domain-containing protein [Pedobacter mucosus]
MLTKYLNCATKGFSRRDLLKNYRYVLFIWVLITLAFVIDSWATHRFNNYLIFENTFRNLLHERSLFAAYPSFHDDANHYGPVFSALIAPFAILPNWLGLLFWNLFNCILLFSAVQSLPLNQQKKNIIGYIAIPCLIESMLNQQFNAGAGALIIFSFTQVNKNNGFWSAMCIVLGTFVKLYGVVGLVFFFFAKKKPAFVGWLILWAIILFLLPMLFASPSFVAHSYIDWKNSLVEKNLGNILGAATDISIMGFFRQLSSHPELSNLMFISIGSVLFMLPFKHIRYFSRNKFQLMMLSSVLIFPVLFSTGSEDCTYIISIFGVGIWYVQERNHKMKNVLLPILLVVTCNFPLLLIPAIAKSHPITLSILSFPYFLVWLRILYNSVRNKHQLLDEHESELSLSLAE